MKKNDPKITDQEFLAILRKNAGLYARTVRAIKAEFGIVISRQGVRQRALTFPEELEDIAQEGCDIAEEGLTDLMRSASDRIKLRAIEVFLKAKAKDRGYYNRTQFEHTGNIGHTHSQIKEIPLEDLSKGARALLFEINIKRLNGGSDN